MDDIKIFKEKVINDYILNNIDITKIGSKDIKTGLRALLDEEPGVKFNYKENVKINEATGKVERLPNELESIEIYYTYIGSDNNPHAGHVKYIIN